MNLDIPIPQKPKLHAVMVRFTPEELRAAKAIAAENNCTIPRAIRALVVAAKKLTTSAAR